jgi:hypothetical protein
LCRHLQKCPKLTQVWNRDAVYCWLVCVGVEGG